MSSPCATGNNMHMIRKQGLAQNHCRNKVALPNQPDMVLYRRCVHSYVKRKAASVTRQTAGDLEFVKVLVDIGFLKGEEQSCCKEPIR